MTVRRGVTLVEVIMAFWLLLATVVMAGALLHRVQRTLRQQEHVSRGMFLAQGQLEEFMRVPSARLQAAEGRFEPPWEAYRWRLEVVRREDMESPFWELEMTVDGPAQSRVRLQAQRRVEPRCLWFCSNRDGLSQLYRVNEDGTELRRMTRTVFDESQPALAPDGQEVAFVSQRGGYAQIYAMPANGSGTARLLVDRPPSVGDPAWSPDGRSLAFTGYERGFSQVFVLNLASGSVENRSQSDRHESQPAWCPDGGLVCVAADPERGGSQLDRLSAQGEVRRRQLTPAGGWTSSPCVAPDGTQVAFMANRDGNPELYLMSLAGGGVRRLSDNLAYDHAPRFSPDGQRLAFWSERGGAPELYTMDLKAGKLRRVLPKPAGSVPGVFEKDPAWAP